MDLTVSIVNYNTRELTLQCINSIISSAGALKYEIIVVDNASEDGSAEAIKNRFPQVKIIENKTNNYFTRANNQAIKISSGKYVLILNSDTVVRNNSLKVMSDFLDKNPKAGAVTCNVITPDGNILFNANRDFNLPLAFMSYTFIGYLFPAARKRAVSKHLYNDLNAKQTHEVDMVGDFCIMVRRQILNNIKGYDESMKLYFTENDLCKNIRNNGWKIYYLPEGEVVHLRGRTVEKSGLRKISPIYESDTIAYIRKYYGMFSAGILNILIKATNIMINLAKYGKYRNIFENILTVSDYIKKRKQ